MEKIKVGIIGAGYIGSLHAMVLARDERVRVVAVADLLAERAEQLARATGAHAVTDVEELIGLVDAVYITTPNTMHTEVALAAIGAGRHVFCEKPMATSLAEARGILDAAGRSDRVFQVGHNRRFAPVYVLLKSMLAERRPHSAHVKMNRGELINPPWVGDKAVTGGFLYETTIHMLGHDAISFWRGDRA